MKDMHKISVLQLEDTFWNLEIFTALTYQKHLIPSTLKYFVSNQKYSLIFVNSYWSELKYYNKKLLDCTKCFNKNLYSVVRATLCSKGEVMLHTSKNSFLNYHFYLSTCQANKDFLGIRFFFALGSRNSEGAHRISN